MDLDVIGNDRDTGRRSGRHRHAVAAVQVLLVLGVVATGLLTWPDVGPRPAVQAEPPPVRAPRCVSVKIDPATAARMRSLAGRHAQIRAVPRYYRDAAEQASQFTGRRVRGEFFLALAYNRTMYGELLRTRGGAAYADRGPVQWQANAFHAVAVSGHDDPTQPLDAFLAVASALLRSGLGEADGTAFDLARRYGASVDQARADAETYAVLIRRGPGPRAGCDAAPQQT